jgi:hypothetical protein
MLYQLQRKSLETNPAHEAGFCVCRRFRRIDVTTLRIPMLFDTGFYLARDRSRGCHSEARFPEPKNPKSESTCKPKGHGFFALAEAGFNLSVGQFAHHGLSTNGKASDQRIHQEESSRFNAMLGDKLLGFIEEGKYLLAFDGRESLEKIINGLACFQIVNQSLHRHSCARKHRSPSHNV